MSSAVGILGIGMLAIVVQRRVWRRLLLLLLVLLVGGCRPPPKAVHLPPPVASSSLGPGDVFSLHIIGEDKLPTEYKVAPDGTVDVPYIARITAAGLEPQQLSSRIRDRLIAEKIYTDPSVIVGVIAYNSKTIVVSGEVKKEGSFPYKPGMTLTRAISQAGGLTSLAKGWGVVLRRRLKDKTVRVVVDYEAVRNNEIPDVPLQAGDTIAVPQKVF